MSVWSDGLSSIRMNPRMWEVKVAGAVSSQQQLGGLVRLEAAGLGPQWGEDAGRRSAAGVQHALVVLWGFLGS